MASTLSLILVTLATTAAATQKSFLRTREAPETPALALSGEQTLLHKDRGHDADNCKCLNWKDSYKTGAAECGHNAEFFMITAATELGSDVLPVWKPTLNSAFCSGFFERLDDNFCVNMNMGPDIGSGQWCFVDPNCESKELVQHDGTHAWKFCHGPAESHTTFDKRLRDYKPLELAAVAKTHGLDMGQLHKMSYPLVPGLLWEDVAAFWHHSHTGDANFGLKEMPEDLKWFWPTLKELNEYMKMRWGNGGEITNPNLVKYLEEIVRSDVPHSFDLETEHDKPNKDVIVWGESVYVVIGDHIYCQAGCE